MKRGKISQREFIKRIMSSHASAAPKEHTQEEQGKMLNRMGFPAVIVPNTSVPAKTAPMHLEHVCGSAVTHLPVKIVNGKLIKQFRCNKEGIVIAGGSADLVWKE